MPAQISGHVHLNQPPQYVVYVFRSYDHNSSSGYASKRLPTSMARLNWQRDSVNDDLVSALTRAEMALHEDSVRRVQIFEQRVDADGHYRTGRMVRHYGPNWLQKLLGMD